MNQKALAEWKDLFAPYSTEILRKRQDPELDRAVFELGKSQVRRKMVRSEGEMLELMLEGVILTLRSRLTPEQQRWADQMEWSLALAP